jgi:IclR family KDG regulon transcriptional repressor
MDKAFIKGIRLIEALAKSEKPRGITELSEELVLTKSNVHRLLQTLSILGYVLKDTATGQYALSLKLWEVGSLVVSRLDVKRVALPHLKTLAELTNETVNLSILIQTEVVYIEKIDSPQPVRANSRVGGRAPAHCSSTGKAMLAYHPAALLDKLGKSIYRLSDNKVISRRSLDLELSKIRQLGYALNQGEITKSIAGVGAPIFGLNNQVIAAVGVAGPAERMRKNVLIKLAPIVIKAALAISKELGYSGLSNKA